jgi:hypothetical protein
MHRVCLAVLLWACAAAAAAAAAAGGERAGLSELGVSDNSIRGTESAQAAAGPPAASAASAAAAAIHRHQPIEDDVAGLYGAPEAPRGRRRHLLESRQILESKGYASYRDGWYGQYRSYEDVVARLQSVAAEPRHSGRVRLTRLPNATALGGDIEVLLVGGNAHAAAASATGTVPSIAHCPAQSNCPAHCPSHP